MSGSLRQVLGAAQERDSPVNVRFHGAFRDSEDCRHFSNAQGLDEAQDDGGTLHSRQAGLQRGVRLP